MIQIKSVKSLAPPFVFTGASPPPPPGPFKPQPQPYLSQWSVKPVSSDPVPDPSRSEWSRK